MLSIHFARLIENHSEELAEGLARRLHQSERTPAYRDIPSDTLKQQLQDLYENLSFWLTTKTEAEIEARYTDVGRRRARQGIPIAQFSWAVIMSKEYLWQFLLREAMADHAMQLLSEIDFLLLLEQFFDRALYYGVSAYEKVAKREAA
ncbi:MAG: histidine kinase N-terminal domain-containing protein [Acidobacteriaceae bacterium]